MKRLLFIIPLLFVASACGEAAPADGGSNDHRLYEEHITLKDGRNVTCIVYSHERAEEGGLSCDFAGAGTPEEFGS